MTDPAPSPPAGQPPVPVRPMPRLGGGLVWSDILAKIEADRPAPTPSLGATGSSLGVAAMHTCADHCQCDEARCSSCADTGHACEDHPDRPWGGITDDINGCHCGGAGIPCPACCDPIPQDGTRSIGDAFTPRKFLRSGLPRIYPSAPIPLGAEPDELLRMADDLNAHGGLDERFVAGLLREVATHRADCAKATHGLGCNCELMADLEAIKEGGNPARLFPPGPLQHWPPLAPAPQPLPRSRWLARAIDRIRKSQ